MATLCRTVALYCGQGMAHLIEIYESGVAKGAADFLALIDCGGNVSAADEPVEYIYQQMKAQMSPKLDLIVVSHQDSDHNNLLGPLGKRLSKTSWEIGQSFMGGLIWSAKHVKDVKDFAKAAASAPKVEWSTDRYSDYTRIPGHDDPPRELAKLGTIFFRVLVSQLAVPRAKTDIKKNASSAVIVVENGARSVILPADATYQTLKFINELYKPWGDKKRIPAVKALGVPHHGAMRTAVEEYEATKMSDEVDPKIITHFAKYLAAGNVFASAGFQNSHGHPADELLQIFREYTTRYKDVHTYVAWEFDNKSGTKRSRYKEITTDYGIYTTVYAFDGNNFSWGNVVMDIGGSSLNASRIDAAHTLAEILEEKGLPAGPWMRRSSHPGALVRPHVVAPPPTAEEIAAAAAEPGAR